MQRHSAVSVLVPDQDVTAGALDVSFYVYTFMQITLCASVGSATAVSQHMRRRRRRRRVTGAAKTGKAETLNVMVRGPAGQKTSENRLNI